MRRAILSCLMLLLCMAMGYLVATGMSFVIGQLEGKFLPSLGELRDGLSAVAYHLFAVVFGVLAYAGTFEQK